MTRRLRRYFQWSWNEWLPGPRWTVVASTIFAALNVVAIVWGGLTWWTPLNVASGAWCAYTGIASWRARRNAVWREAMFSAKVTREIERDIQRAVERRQEQATWN